MSGLTYKGWSVRDWGSYQTQNPKPSPRGMTRPYCQWYMGYATLEPSLWDLGMPEIPLELRYADFKDRLGEAINRRPNNANT